MWPCYFLWEISSPLAFDLTQEKFILPLATFNKPFYRFSFMRSVFARATKRSVKDSCSLARAYFYLQAVPGLHPHILHIYVQGIIRGVRKRWPLQIGRPGEWRDFRSSKEPEEIQSCDPEAYNPKAVHIGPRHSLRCSPIFRQLKQHKCWRVNRLLQQSKHSLESMVQRLLLRLTPVINRNLFSRLFAGTIIGGIVLMLLFD